MTSSYALTHDFIALMFDQVNVSICNTAPAVTALQAFAKTPADVRKNGSCISLMFDGYDDQRQELYQNPVVCAFVQKLTAQFPYWLHFLRKDDDSLLVIIMCLMGSDAMQVTPMAGGRVGLALDSERFSTILQDLFGCLNALYAEHGLNEAENSAMSQQVKRWLDRICGA